MVILVVFAFTGFLDADHNPKLHIKACANHREQAFL